MKRAYRIIYNQNRNVGDKACLQVLIFKIWFTLKTSSHERDLEPIKKMLEF